jgi:uncharacterized membrane protein
VNDAAYNAWRITSLTSLPAWALLLAALAAAAGVWFTGRGLRAEPSLWKKRVLWSLRAASAALLVVLLLEPGLELRAETRVKARVALLLDTSKSMRLPARAASAGEPPSRMAEQLSWLQRHEADLRALGARFQVDVYGFDKELAPQDAGKLAALPAQPGFSRAAQELAGGNATDLFGALQAAARGGAGGRPLAGIVLASDGADNEGLEAAGQGALAELGKLGAPVFALPVGGEAQLDLAVEHVQHDDFAFVRSPVKLRVRLSQHGLGAKTVPVRLQREGQLVAQAEARLDGKARTTEVELSFVPDRTGKFAFTVSVPVYDGEALTENNQQSFTLNVIRDRVRVLLVVGHPSWDVRFLRQLLKRDPNVDLISFFILRTPTDDQRVSQEELSLIPFPTNEIFNEQLRTFDLVIFQDFNHRPYRMSQYLDGIAAYVRDGGAFAMLGGDQSFSAGDYLNTSIEGLLPFSLLPPGVPAVDETPATLKLTEAGKRHPLTELVPGAAQNEALWARLPKLPGLNTAGPLKPGAQVLLQAQDGRPVLAVGEAGRGRVLALTTDSSWQWSFVAAGQELGPRAYETFWHSAIRWLVRDPALTPMRVQAERPVFEPGEQPALDAQVRGSDYGAAGGAQLVVQLTSGEKGTLPPLAGGSAGENGDARIVLPPLSEGSWRATVIARKADGTEVGVAEEAFTVATGGPELLQPAPRPDLLESIAKATGGRLIDEKTALASLPLRDPERVEVGQRVTRPLWDRWVVLALLCLVAGAEWILRRRWGYA